MAPITEPGSLPGLSLNRVVAWDLRPCHHRVPIHDVKTCSGCGHPLEHVALTIEGRSRINGKRIPEGEYCATCIRGWGR